MTYNPFTGSGNQATDSGGFNPFTGSGSQGGGGSGLTSAPPELPHMAQAVDKYGQPYYGEGFQGFARKVFGKIFDPAKLLPKANDQQAKIIEEQAAKGGEVLNKKGWDKWIESWTGITAEDFTKTSLAISLAFRGTDEEGNINEEAQAKNVISTGAGVLYRGGGQVISTGLEALGLFDKVSRKVQSFNVAMDEIGDSASILPDISRYDEILPKLLGDTETAKRLGNILDAVTDITPPALIYNVVRAATAGKSMYEKTQVVKDNLRASNMLYTMYWDESKKDEYYRRVRSGENPDLVMRDLENPWVELAGSVVADPTTYMGMGIIGKVGKAQTPVRIFGKQIMTLPWETVARVPGFTDILGLKNIGKARLLNAGNEFTEIVNPQTKKALEALGNVTDETQALDVLKTAIKAARTQVDDFRKSYGFFTPESTAKAELTKKTVGTFFQGLASRFRNPDDIFETFKAFRNLTSTNNQTAVRAFSHLKEVYGSLPFTNAGMQSMEFMTRVIDEVDVSALLTKHADNIPAFTDEALNKVYGMVDDFFPSVDDMAKAMQDVKQGVVATERQKFLINSYNDLKKTRPQVIWANNINKALTENKVYRGLQAFYANTLMGMRPAYATRNLIQNSVVIWHDLGFRAGLETFTTGAEVLVKSTASKILKQDWVTPVLTRESQKVKDILGFLPTQMLRGTGQAGQGSFAFLGVGQDVEKVHSAILTRYVVEQQMDNFLRHGGIPSVDGLPREMAESLLAYATENYGNVTKTLERFRADQATGFFDTWRHLELDPAFKDTLRRSNLLDELLDIRATAPDPVTFAEQMDVFVKKIDDLAMRTADEPALVSAENPIADAVATVEKAFDEGGRKIMNEEELNQFRALVELRGQLRNAYQDYVDVMRDRIGRLLPPEQIRPFEEMFSNLRNTLENGNTKWRNYADELYKGVYAQSRKGENPALLWNQVRTVMLDIEDGQPVLKKISLANDYPDIDPSTLTNRDFDGLMWRWFKDKQDQFWRGYTQDTITGQSAILDEMAKTAGANIDEIRMAEYGTATNPRLTQITDLTKQIQEWEQYLKPDDLVEAAQLRKANTLLETAEEGAQAARNVNAPPPIDQEVSISSDIEGNPLKLLQDKGGVTIDEFSDIMGGKRGTDKQGVMPGLFKKGGMGLDDAGRLLSDSGFITPEQADDLNFVRDYIRNPTGKTTTFKVEGARLSDMELKNVPNWQGGKSHLFNAVNADRAKKGLMPYATIDDVPFDEAVDVLRRKTKPMPPYVEGTQPTVTRQLYENLKGGFREALEDFKNGTLNKWGERTPLDTRLTDEQETILSKWASELDKRVIAARTSTAAIADSTRDFILHDYNKTHGDKFASYFLMYHYWGSRTYMRWGERVADSPSWISTYAKWKETMNQVHSDQPEFYRYNLPVGKLPGMNNSPMFFNLEATLNPLNSLTGVDFNDPKRRVDWFSSSVDDMGKFGFNLAMPLQWAMAFRLYNMQEDEAARRWLGRLIPVTQDLKHGLNLLKEKTGIDLMPDISVLPGAKYGEFDPFINAQGGFDAYEEKRIARALTTMVMNGEITAEQSYDIMYSRQGEAFDEAVHRAINERAYGQMSSYFLGVGFKSRTEGDMKVEEFYQKYYQLISIRENVSPNEYKQQLDKLLTDYEFGNTVLLAARGGDERDAVYAFNVLSRIPPGDSGDILEAVGLDQALINKFYQDKGDFSDWTPQDRERFKSAMLDLGATYALPDGATREEWNDVKQLYKDIQEGISEELGLPYQGNERGVWDVINTYYDLKEQNGDAADLFKKAHPEIDEAFALLNEAKISDPLLAKYYASLDTVESYYNGKIRSELFNLYGKDILLKQSEYYEKAYEGKAAQKAYLRQHPELKAYWEKKRQLEAGMNQTILRIATMLPEGADGAELREDFVAQNSTQEALAEFAGSQNIPWEQISTTMSAPLEDSVMRYWMEGQPLSTAAQKELDFVAKVEGYYNADDFLRQVGYSLFQSQQAPQQAGGYNPFVGAP